MRDDITTSAAFRGRYEFIWRKSRGVGNKPLTIKHILPCFMMLGLGIVISMIIFILEATRYSLNKSKTGVKTIDSETRATLRGIANDKDINDTIMKMADIAETGDGRAIATDKDINDTISVMAEIQEALNDE